MKILILGGTGLISTAITRELLARGDGVTLYNRGQREARFPDGAKRLYGDRSDFPAFEAQMQDAGMFDGVIDMICFNSEQAESAIRAFKGRVGYFVFCSTVNVYTKPAHTYPILENFPRLPIMDDYGMKKAQCEDVFMEAHARGDLNVTIIRPAHTYGEGGLLSNSFGRSATYIDRIRKGKPIIVHGDGSSLWVVCHIDDCGHSFVHACGNANTFGKSYHVTGEEWMTWNHYHELTTEALGAPKPKLVHIPTELLGKIAPKRAAITVTNYSGNNVFDNSTAKRDLDFHYTINWREGVKRTVAWMDANHKIENSDDDPFEDRIIAAWERLSGEMQTELTGLEG